MIHLSFYLPCRQSILESWEKAEPVPEPGYILNSHQSIKGLTHRQLFTLTFTPMGNVV